jgi:hypothetical protein
MINKMNRESALKVIEEWLINPKIEEYEIDKKNAECGTYLVQNIMVIDRLKETLQYVKENLK